MRECSSLETLTLSIITVAPGVADLPTTLSDSWQERRHKTILDANCEVLLSAPQALRFVVFIWVHVGPYEPGTLSNLESLSDSWARIDDALSRMPCLENVAGIVNSINDFDLFIGDLERIDDEKMSASAEDAPLYGLLSRVLPRVHAAGLLESCSLSGV